ncbi:hypothetical protein Tco_1146523 [Tanacetum coccineum]
MNMTLQSSITDKILAAQKEAMNESTRLQKGLDEMIEQRSDWTLYYLDQIWVPLKGDKTSSKRRVKKKVTLSANDNIIFDDPDTTLELAKSISQTKAEEAEAARQVHATYARIVSETVPETAKKKSGSRSSKSVVIQDTPSAPKSKPATSKTKLKGAPSLTPKEQEAANIMQALKESKKTSKRQPSTKGSNEGTGVPNEEKDITEEKVILEWGDEQDSEYSDDDNDNVKKDDKDGDADDKGDDHISDTQDADDEDVKTESDEDDIYKYKIHVRKDEDEEMINDKVDDSDKGDEEITDAAKANAEKTSKDTIDTEINSLLEVKIQYEVPHTQSSSVLSVHVYVIFEPTVPTLVQESPSTATVTTLPPPSVSTTPSVPQQTTTSIPKPPTTTDAQIITTAVPESNALTAVELRVAKLEKMSLEKYDLKSALYQSMHVNKSFNRNPTNHRLYHALIEALIEDENVMDKGVANTVTMMMMKTLQLDQTRETPKGKASSNGSKTGKPAPEKEPVKEPIIEMVMDDAGDHVARDDNQPQDTSKPKTRKTPNPDWFKQPLMPPTPDSKWNKRQVVLDQPEQPWFNKMVSATKDPLTFNDLMATPIDFSKVLQCPPGHQTIAADYFFNNDLEYLKTSDLEVTYTTSITKTKVARYEIKRIEDMVRKFSKHNVYSTKSILGVKSVSVKKLNGYGHLEEITVKRSDQQLYKFKEGDFVDLHLNDIEDMLLLVVQHKLFHLDGSVIVDFIVALRMFTRSLILKRRVKDLQLGVESYQKKLNITKPQKTFPKIEFKEPYTLSYNPPGIVYEDLNKQKRVL